MDVFQFMGDGLFMALASVIALLLYSNSLYGGFVWDDRAAVIANQDVCRPTTSVQIMSYLSELWSHDFWGQDIKLPDSHKSFRPITVLSYRLNFLVNGLDAFGYHLLNAIIFALSAVLLYIFAVQFLNRGGARIAVCIFVFHPIHVEAVASVVGRADLLCGMFYLASLIAYTMACRFKSSTDVNSIVSLSCAWIFAICASLSKEIGFTVFAVLGVIEVTETLKIVIVKSKYFLGSEFTGSSPAKKSNSNSKSVSPLAALASKDFLAKKSIHIGGKLLVKSLMKSLTNQPSMIRVALLVVSMGTFMKLRMDINGPHMLQKWTILENHIHLLPNFSERALSYAQMHFWYLFKLVYPRYLCFDYGYACIPTVHTIFDMKNAIPLSAYGILIWIAWKAIREARVTLIISLALLLLPLLPALNILFPVGTTLAERLLFVPSIGFSLLVGELLSVDMRNYWYALSNSLLGIVNYVFWSKQPASAPTSPVKSRQSEFKSPTKNQSQNSHGSNGVKAISNYQSSAAATTPFALYILLSVVALMWTVRIYTRNNDWKSEIKLYGSSLEVCPNSIKALTNYAVLAMGAQNYEGALEAALRAAELYPNQTQALVNSGIAYQKVQNYALSAHMFEKALKVKPGHAKTWGYLGGSLFSWSSQILAKAGDIVDATEKAKRMEDANLLRNQAAETLEEAVRRGFQAPSILHMTGSVLMEVGKLELAAQYLEYALQQSHRWHEQRMGSKHVPVEDDIQWGYTYNQLGLAYARLKQNDKAMDSYRRGLQASPLLFELHTNLGNLYRDMGRNDDAREVMRLCIKLAEQHNVTAPPALLNNFGLLELDLGNYDTALPLFYKALQALMPANIDVSQLEQETNKIVNYLSENGSRVIDVVQQNIQRAKAGLQYQQQQEKQGKH